MTPVLLVSERVARRHATLEDAFACVEAAFLALDGGGAGMFPVTGGPVRAPPHWPHRPRPRSAPRPGAGCSASGSTR